MHKLAFVVPTKDRPNDLRKMLTSLNAQSRKPNQVIIVDGSDPDVRHVVKAFSALPIVYVRVFPPSLAKQRNAGMQALRSEITLAGYLDDDIELEPDAVEKMLDFWEKAPTDFGGAAFNMTNSPPLKWGWLKHAVDIDSPIPGKVLPSGFPSTIRFQEKNIETDWLYGGATVWRRGVVERFPYDEWFLGTGYMEDVDFSFKVREKYRLALVASARLAHYSPPIRRDKRHLLGKWEIVNRMYVVRKYRCRGLSVARAWATSFALVAMHMAKAVLTLDGASWDQGRGNIMGIVSELTGKRERITGHLK